MRVLITGGTGYIGSALIPKLIADGHEVFALVRPGSQHKLSPGCHPIVGDALDAATYASQLPACAVFVHLVGVAHPAPWKARQFREVDQVSLEASVQAATARGIRRFVYVSVAQPAPVMRAYQRVRAACEQTIAAASLHAVVLRPWYVLGPGHRWPYALLPLYHLLESIPATRSAAQRLGLLSRDEMVEALVWSIETPLRGFSILGVPEIRGLTWPCLSAASRA